MKISRRRLKEEARERMYGKYTIGILAMFLVFFFSIVLSWVYSVITPFEPSQAIQTGSLPIILISTVAYVIILLLEVILSSGIHALYLNMARETDYKISDLFYGFTHQPDQVILIVLRILLLLLPCLLPYIAVTALIVYLFYEKTTLLAVLLILSAIVFTALSLMILLHYALVLFLRVDYPQITASELLSKSRVLMSGNRMAYFQLELSFLGLLLLGILSLGIGMLWIRPYMYMTHTLFYLELAGSVPPETKQ